MILKEYFRWYICDARGRKAKNGRPVMSTVLNCAERLFGGFEETMGIVIVKEDRREIFNVRKIFLFTLNTAKPQSNRMTVDQEDADSKGMRNRGRSHSQTELF